MQKENKHIYMISLIIFVFITRFSFFLDYNVFLSDDDAGFALAAHDYNIRDSRPHLPGYFLLIKSIEVVDLITSDTFISMKILVVAFSILSALVIFKLFLFHFSPKNSFWLLIVLFTNPLIWFYQCTPESYIYDLFFSSLIALLYYKRESYFYYLPIISVMGGIRMSSAFFLIPLYVYISYIYFKENRLKLNLFLYANIVGLIVTALWLYPLLNSVGGLSAYLNLYKTHNPMPAIGPLKNLVGFFSFAITIFIPFFPLFVILSFKKNRKWFIIDKPLIFNFIWIVPALLFFIFGHYSKGYIFLIYTSMILLFGLIIERNHLKNSLIYFVVVIQTIFFLLYPYQPVHPDTMFRREERTISLVEVVWNRLNNGYLHSLSRLENRNQYNLSLDSCINYLSNIYSDFIVFDGKSSLMTINSEAYRHPDVTFVTQKNFFREDEYILQKKYTLEYKYGLVELYKKVFILCDNRLVKRYNPLVEQVYKTNLHSLIRVKQGREEEFKELYESLYAK